MTKWAPCRRCCRRRRRRGRTRRMWTCPSLFWHRCGAVESATLQCIVAQQTLLRNSLCRRQNRAHTRIIAGSGAWLPARATRRHLSPMHFPGNLPAGLRAVLAQSPRNAETCRSLGNKWGAWGRAPRLGSTRRGPMSGSIGAIIMTFLTLSGGAPRAALRGVGAFSHDRRPAFLCLACRRGADAHRLVSDTSRVVALRASRRRGRATKLCLAEMVVGVRSRSPDTHRLTWQFVHIECTVLRRRVCFCVNARNLRKDYPITAELCNAGGWCRCCGGRWWSPAWRQCSGSRRGWGTRAGPWQ